MERNVKCHKCEILFSSGKRGALPEFCSSCRPSAYKEKYYHYQKINKDSPSSLLIRREVLERDNFTCQECGSQKQLDVHHKDGNSYRRVGAEANNSLSNLITLCHKCHMNKHFQPSTKRLNLLMYHEKYPKMSNAALGRVFKLTRERVRQILNSMKDS